MCLVKFTFLLGVVLAGAYSTSAGSCKKDSSHDAIFGKRRSGDTLLFMEHPRMESKLLRVVTYDISFPPRGEKKPDEITAIEIYDQKRNGHGGCTYLQDGGVGQNHATIHLKSQRNHGLDFIVKIYGVKREY